MKRLFAFFPEMLTICDILISVILSESYGIGEAVVFISIDVNSNGPSNNYLLFNYVHFLLFVSHCFCRGSWCHQPATGVLSFS